MISQYTVTSLLLPCTIIQITHGFYTPKTIPNIKRINNLNLAPSISTTSRVINYKSIQTLLLLKDKKKKRDGFASRFFNGKKDKESNEEDENQIREDELKGNTTTTIEENIINATILQDSILYYPDDDDADDVIEPNDNQTILSQDTAVKDEISIEEIVTTNKEDTFIDVIASDRKKGFWNRIFSKKESVDVILQEDPVPSQSNTTVSSLPSKSEDSETNETITAITTPKPISKFRKRLFTTVSIIVCLFLAAPAPKRFSMQDGSEKYVVTSKLLDDKYYMPKKQELKSDDGKEEPERDLMKFVVPSQEDIISKLPSPQKLNTLSPYSHYGTSNAKSSSSFVADAVKKIGPSVVRIDTESYATSSSSPFDLYEDDLNDNEEYNSGRIIKSGQGSGIIFSKDGLVLTNAHVVDDANRVYVTLTDGRKFVAEVKGVDEMVDIAVLKILCNSPWGGYAPWGSNSNTLPPLSSSNSDTKLPVAALGNSDSLQVGEFVIAVGNPAGLDNSVTMGIISSLKRSSEEIGLPGKKVTFIQTDAAVNPGNSGGPLVNEHGEIIGINTCIRANMEGIAFAIPINKAKEIMYQLAAGENIKHGYIGVVMMTITPDFARQNNMDANSPVGIIPEIKGVMIERVLQNTPAANAGLRRFDIILSINGVEVHTASDAANIVDAATVGQDLELRVLRLGVGGGDGNKPIVVYVNPADLGEKLRQRKEMRKMQERQQPFGGGSGGRIYVLPFPTTP